MSKETRLSIHQRQVAEGRIRIMRYEQLIARLSLANQTQMSRRAVDFLANLLERQRTSEAQLAAETTKLRQAMAERSLQSATVD